MNDSRSTSPQETPEVDSDGYSIERPSGPHVEGDTIRVTRPAGVDDKTWALIKENTNRFVMLLEIIYLPADKQALVHGEIRRVLDEDRQATT